MVQRPNPHSNGEKRPVKRNGKEVGPPNYKTARKAGHLKPRLTTEERKKSKIKSSAGSLQPLNGYKKSAEAQKKQKKEDTL